MAQEFGSVPLDAHARPPAWHGSRCRPLPPQGMTRARAGLGARGELDVHGAGRPHAQGRMAGLAHAPRRHPGTAHRSREAEHRCLNGLGPGRTFQPARGQSACCRRGLVFRLVGEGPRSPGGCEPLCKPHLRHWQAAGQLEEGPSAEWPRWSTAMGRSTGRPLDASTAAEQGPAERQIAGCVASRAGGIGLAGVSTPGLIRRWAREERMPRALPMGPPRCQNETRTLPLVWNESVPSRASRWGLMIR